MSARDEIARALHRADVEPRRFDPHWNVHEWDELTDEAREYWRRLAGALMPIVERVAHDRDGERYRWLRYARDGGFWSCHEKDGYGGQVLMSGPDLDAAIDAAMRGEG